MLIGIFNGLIDNLVCYYLSSICIISIICWMIWAYTHNEKWQEVIRDCVMYLTIIFISALVMVIFRNMPSHQAARPVFTGIAWFAFAMLLIMEMLWLAYVINNIVQVCRESLTNFYSNQSDKSHDFRIR